MKRKKKNTSEEKDEAEKGEKRETGERKSMKDIDRMGKEELKNECRNRKLQKWSKLGLEDMRRLVKKEALSQMKIGIMKRRRERGMKREDQGQEQQQKQQDCPQQ